MTGKRTWATRLVVPMIAVMVFGIIAPAAPSPMPVQDSPTVVAADDATVLANRIKLRKTLWQAVRNARKSGDITWRQARRIRTASLVPAVLEDIEDLAVYELAMSADDTVPLDEDGKVIRSQIDWDGLLKFLEGLLPLILKFLEAIG